ncbi:Uncharacterized protein Cadr_000001991, partial [Camelus dromedarius]
QEPWELALLTKTWHTNLANIKLPFLEEIAFGGSIRLKKCKTTKDGLVPSAEFGLLHIFYFSAIKLEREYEMKRLDNLKRQENAAEEIRFSLREKQIGLRRPLPPK